MIRQRLLSLLVVAAFAGLVGCDASTDVGRDADLANGGLMPDAEPVYTGIYIQNQGEVKLNPERSISYEPLSSFYAKASLVGQDAMHGSQSAGAAISAGSAGQGGGGYGKLADSFVGIFSSISKGSAKGKSQDANADNDEDEADDLLDDDDDDLMNDDDIDDDDDEDLDDDEDEEE